MKFSYFFRFARLSKISRDLLPSKFAKKQITYITYNREPWLRSFICFVWLFFWAGRECASLLHTHQKCVFPMTTFPLFVFVELNKYFVRFLENYFDNLCCVAGFTNRGNTLQLWQDCFNGCRTGELSKLTDSISISMSLSTPAVSISSIPRLIDHGKSWRFFQDSFKNLNGLYIIFKVSLGSLKGNPWILKKS